jgi:transposase
MAGERYNDEFKIAAVRQITQEGHSVSSVADRLGVTTKSLYNWKARFGDDSPAYQSKKSSDDELRRLKTELKRVTQERDILKEPTAVFFAGESKKNTRL